MKMVRQVISSISSCETVDGNLSFIHSLSASLAFNLYSAKFVNDFILFF